MLVAIAAGGTGGHFYPGLAVAKYLMTRNSNVFFFVKTNDYVIPLLERENIPYRTIHAAGFSRSVHPRNALALLKLAIGQIEAFSKLVLSRPDVLLVMGGYLSVPPALAARLLRIPVVLHEQNAKPGLANQLISKWVDRVALSFEESRVHFRKSSHLTGNPIRPELKQLPAQAEARARLRLSPQKKTFLIFGGSLGAHKLNQLVTEALKKLPALAESWQVIHLTGRGDEPWVRKEYESAGIQYFVEAYCHDMAVAYAASDFVICRAGASTVTELMAVKKPALLVPYPLATEGHQLTNAEVLSKLGVAWVYEQKFLEKEGLAPILEKLVSEEITIETKRLKYDSLALPPFEAAHKIADLLAEVARPSQQKH